ncbi:MAG: hypothetical protein JO174_09805 [Herbaspirillum sp.]|nr:hypothetical protein [Herbaspirillum sp.]
MKLKLIALAALVALNGCASAPADKSSATAPVASPTPPSQPAAATTEIATPTPVATATAVTAVPAAAAAAAAASAAASAAPDAPATILGVAYTTKFSNGSRLKEVPEEVFIVRPKNTQNVVAGQVALNVVMFALGGGLGFNGFSKEDLKGEKFEDVKDRQHVRNPVATDYISQLSKKVNSALQSRPKLQAGAFKNAVMVAGGSSTLIYESLSGEEANMFKMNTELSVYKRKESAGLFTFSPLVEVSCNRVSEKALPLEDWAKDDYLMVQQWVNETLDQCSQKVITALPEMLAS